MQTERGKSKPNKVSQWTESAGKQANLPHGHQFLSKLESQKNNCGTMAQKVELFGHSDHRYIWSLGSLGTQA